MFHLHDFINNSNAYYSEENLQDKIKTEEIYFQLMNDLLGSFANSVQLSVEPIIRLEVNFLC